MYRQSRLNVLGGPGPARLMRPLSFLSFQVNSALHPSGVAKSSTSFGCKGGKVTSAGWQVTLCDLI